MRRLLLISFCLLLSLDASSQPPDRPVRLLIPEIAGAYDINHEDYYFSHLLELALSKSEASYGPVVIEQAEKRTVDHRLIASLQRGDVDVLWTNTNAEKELHLLPVRIPLLKDLSSYRVLLIRAGDQARFSAINNLEDLRQLRGGISPLWTDAAIMEHNGLVLVSAVEYSQLFRMLSAGRFDYFSRGLYQIHNEPGRFPTLPLAIEEELMLHYRNDYYFFVRRDNPELAARLTEGLKLAQEDGSFDVLFNSIPNYRWGLEQLQLNQRRIIVLNDLPSTHATK